MEDIQDTTDKFRHSAPQETESTPSFEHSISIGELYEQTLIVGHEIYESNDSKNPSLSIFGERLAQLSLWRDFFPNQCIAELPSCSLSSRLNSSALKLLSGAGKTVLRIALESRGSEASKILDHDSRILNALLDSADSLLDQYSPKNQDCDDESSSEISDSDFNTNCSVETEIELFTTFVRCLMNLGPTIQDAYVLQLRADEGKMVLEMGEEALETDYDIFEMGREALEADEEAFETEREAVLKSQVTYNFSKLLSKPHEPHDPAAVYISLIFDRFRNAEHYLAERLGRANRQRSKRIYLDAVNVQPTHRDNLSPMIDSGSSSTFAPTANFHDSALGSSIAQITEYTPSVNLRMTLSEADDIPLPPIEALNGKPFKCWICKRTISNISNKLQWKSHVLEDIKPYICCVESCLNLTPFPTRASWLTHTFVYHKWWEILDCESSDTHSDDTGRCRLCKELVPMTMQDYAKHMGGHLEVISLISLPKNADVSSAVSYRPVAKSNAMIARAEKSNLHLHHLANLQRSMTAPAETNNLHHWNPNCHWYGEPKVPGARNRGCPCKKGP